MRWSARRTRREVRNITPGQFAPRPFGFVGRAARTLLRERRAPVPQTSGSARRALRGPSGPGSNSSARSLGIGRRGFAGLRECGATGQPAPRGRPAGLNRSSDLGSKPASRPFGVDRLGPFGSSGLKSVRPLELILRGASHLSSERACEHRADTPADAGPSTTGRLRVAPRSQSPAFGQRRGPLTAG